MGIRRLTGVAWNNNFVNNGSAHKQLDIDIHCDVCNELWTWEPSKKDMIDVADNWIIHRDVQNDIEWFEAWVTITCSNSHDNKFHGAIHRNGTTIIGDYLYNFEDGWWIIGEYT